MTKPIGKLYRGTVLTKKKEERENFKLGDIMVRMFYGNLFILIINIRKL